jgi:hypothetical protein
VDEYVNSETNKISLKPNQAIYLFELGTTDVNNAAADFQDLVVVVTLARNRSSLEESDGGQEGVTGPRLIRVDPKTGEKETVMELTHPYDSLAHIKGMTFQATVENAVFQIDAADDAKSESMVRMLDADQRMHAMAMAGTKLSAFEDAQEQKMLPVNPDVYERVGGAKDIDMQDLGTMIFADPEKVPEPGVKAYD